MKAILALAAVAAALVVPNSGAVQPGPATIRVTSERLSSRVIDGDVDVSVYAIFNRPAFPRAIGAAVITCRKAAAAATVCYEYLRLSRGQVVAEGLIVDKTFYRLAVTGGTGYYDNIGGTLTVRATGPRTQQLVFDLNAF